MCKIVGAISANIPLLKSLYFVPNKKQGTGFVVWAVLLDPSLFKAKSAFP